MNLGYVRQMFDFTWRRVLIHHLANVGVFAPHLCNQLTILGKLSKTLDIFSVPPIAFNMVDFLVGLCPPAQLVVLGGVVACSLMILESQFQCG